MAGSLSPRAVALASALAAAKHAALAVQGEDDGGTANLDSPFLFPGEPRLTAPVVQRAAAAAGVHIGSRYRSSFWNGWFLGSLVKGQGAMRTRMAEAAAKALQGAGEDAGVYYRID
ncbi:MAG TPA: hypothetical protein VFJ85_02955 [Acidimicrobiales bacterium]|nr:hypothetical protein [Acidimicrobiales bacterium]